MCESVPVASLGDADLNREITAVARAEAASAGRRLAAVAELATRRLGAEVARFRERWAADAMDCCAAEVASDLVITHRQAVAMIYQALDYSGASRWSGICCVTARSASGWRRRCRGGPG